MKHRRKLEKRLALVERQLELAAEAIRDNIYGADRWVETHTRNVARMRTMLDIHTDDSMPDGTIVNLAHDTVDNEVAMALRDREDLRSVSEVNAFDDMNSLSSMWED